MKEGSDQNKTHLKVTEPEVSHFAAKEIIPHMEKYKIWAFYGDLGAGKTTLIKEICAHLGIDKNEVNSPTFALVNTYNGKMEHVHHFDFYRIESEEEAYDIGYEEYFYGGDLCLIEWPERVTGLLPEDTAKVRITHDKESNHRLYEIDYA